VNKKLTLQVFIITLTRLVLNTGFRFVYPFLPVLARGLGVGVGSVSLAVSSRALAAAVGPIFAVIADTRGRRFGMLTGVLLFLIGLGAVLVWPTYPAFFLALILTSFAKSIFDPSIWSYLSDRVSYDVRGRAIGVTELAWSISFILGVPLMGFLIARGGWVTPFPVLAIATGICLVLLLWQIPADAPVQAAREGVFEKFRLILTSPMTLLFLSVSGLISAANEVINVVFGVWIESAFGLQVAALGAASLVIGLSELSGEALVSLLTDRLGKTRSVAGGVVLNMAAALSLPILGVTPTGAFISLFLFYLTYEFALVSFIPLVTEVYPEARATFMALIVTAIMLGRAFGALIAPGAYSAGILASAGAAILLDLLAVLVLWRIYRTAAVV
jgi:predicted MFS family arabinose efflux permease